MNTKVVKSFLKEEEKKSILSFIETLSMEKSSVENLHINSVLNKINGSSYIFDISQTEVSKYLSTFQSSDNVLSIRLPKTFYNLIDRISYSINIPNKNVFLQIIVMDKGGKISPHYDTGFPGHINYKCNISILSEDYKLYIEKESLDIEEGDLYCFEASLYKHWTNEFNSKRILLSYGFGLPYKDLNREENDPRVRLSTRIVKYFQKTN